MPLQSSKLSLQQPACRIDSPNASLGISTTTTPFTSSTSSPSSSSSSSLDQPHSKFVSNDIPALRSQSIPISSKHLYRTDSEIQLCIEEERAEQRDYCFYSRVIHGVHKMSQSSTNRHLQLQNQLCLQHIMQTRTGETFATATQHIDQIPIIPTTTSLLIDNSEEDASSNIGLSIDDEGIILPTMGAATTTATNTTCLFHTLNDQHHLTCPARTRARVPNGLGMVTDIVPDWMQDRSVETITAEAVALTNQYDEDDMIFDLDL